MGQTFVNTHARPFGPPKKVKTWQQRKIIHKLRNIFIGTSAAENITRNQVGVQFCGQNSEKYPDIENLAFYMRLGLVVPRDYGYKFKFDFVYVSDLDNGNTGTVWCLFIFKRFSRNIYILADLMQAMMPISTFLKIRVPDRLLPKEE